MARCLKELVDIFEEHEYRFYKYNELFKAMLVLEEGGKPIVIRNVIDKNSRDRISQAITNFLKKFEIPSNEFRTVWTGNTMYIIKTLGD